MKRIVQLLVFLFTLALTQPTAFSQATEEDDDITCVGIDCSERHDKDRPEPTDPELEKLVAEEAEADARVKKAKESCEAQEKRTENSLAALEDACDDFAKAEEEFNAAKDALDTARAEAEQAVKNAESKLGEFAQAAHDLRKLKVREAGQAAANAARRKGASHSEIADARRQAEAAEAHRQGDSTAGEVVKSKIVGTGSNILTEIVTTLAPVADVAKKTAGVVGFLSSYENAHAPDEGEQLSEGDGNPSGRALGPQDRQDLRDHVAQKKEDVRGYEYLATEPKNNLEEAARRVNRMIDAADKRKEWEKRRSEQANREHKAYLKAEAKRKAEAEKMKKMREEGVESDPE